MGWDQSDTEKLRELLLEGLSASDMARRIGGGKSRNSIIGKIHRMGLKFLSTYGPAEGEVRKKPMYTPVRRPPKETVMPKQNLPAPTNDPVAMLDLGNQHCRFPIWPDNTSGAPRFLHCGADKAESGGAYCDYHRARIAGHGTASERNAKTLPFGVAA